MLEQIAELRKTLEAGGYNVAPGSLVQGSALGKENLTPVMNIATFRDKSIKLQKQIKVEACKSNHVQFVRQLDYGTLGGSAVLEGAVGSQETSKYSRYYVPMAYYVHVRYRTVQADMIESFDGVKAEARLDEDAAHKIAADIELHLFRGKADYSNGGYFDGSPAAISEMEPGQHGLDIQVRSSDLILTSQDLMLQEYGADISCVTNQNGALTQSTVEDIFSKARMNHGSPEKLYLDPLTLASYNKIAYNKERIVLAGSPQQAHGASLREQFVADGVISIEASRFLSAKTRPGANKPGSPNTPIIASLNNVADNTTLQAGTYTYQVTAVNEVGESIATAPATITASTGDRIEITITHPAGPNVLYFNVYRSHAGGSRTYFIGRVKISSGTSTLFVDRNNKLPNSITGFAVDFNSGLTMYELAPFSSIPLAQVDMRIPKAYYRFVTLAVALPRFNQLIDNITQ